MILFDLRGLNYIYLVHVEGWLGSHSPSPSPYIELATAPRLAKYFVMEKEEEVYRKWVNPLTPYCVQIKRFWISEFL